MGFLLLRLCFAMYARHIVARPMPKAPCEDALVWYTFVAHRKRWTVWLVPRDVIGDMFADVCKDDDERSRIVGGCVWRKKWILVDAGLPQTGLKKVTFHEKMHACHGDPGDTFYGDAHEKSVTRMEKPLLRALEKSCALRFPPLPHGWKKMRRRVSKNAPQVVI